MLQVVTVARFLRRSPAE